MKLPWYMRQKPGVTLIAGLGGFFTVVDAACAQPWAATTAPGLCWKALASSADGTRLVAAANVHQGYGFAPPTPIYVSTNAGATWIQTGTPDNDWSSVACSADGAKIVAVATTCTACWTPGLGDGLIYTSPDLGASWTPTSAPSNNWTSVASSADGARLVAVAAPATVWDTNGNWRWVGDGTVYRSLDSGASWSRTGAPTNNWTSVASSADGAKLVAVAAPLLDPDGNCFGDGAIYSSLDSGATWSRTGAPTNCWCSVASSADGAKLVAAAGISSNPDDSDGLIYTSGNSGMTWTPTSAPSTGWSAVASSADGTKLLASANASIYASTNSGATWTATTGAPTYWWTAVASSADGYRAVALCCGSICTLPYSGPWRLADAPADWWVSGASSADGAKLVAVAYWGGTICTSSNSGAAWTRTSAPLNRWCSVASSADGAKLVAAAGISSNPDGGDGLIYTSGNSGMTWTPTSAPSKRSGYCVASSADGTKLVAVADQIYTSSDSGATWTQTSAPSNAWSCVASSADGTKLVALADQIYTSSDSGATWTQTSAPSNSCCVASSADGSRLIVGADRIYTSTNSGATWTPASAPSGMWSAVASSADGIQLIAVCGDVYYISTNSGAAWTPAGAKPAGLGGAVFCSADGGNIVALGYYSICTLQSPAPVPPLPPSPRMAVGLSGAGLGLSWLVPSSRFVLQQNSDLDSTNWVDVPASPTLDFTNLHYRVTLTPSLGRSYFRLKQQ